MRSRLASSHLVPVHGVQYAHEYFRSGKLVSEKPERISGALKYNWKEGVSKSLSLAS